MNDSNNKKSSMGGFLMGALATLAIGGFYLFGSKNARRNREKIDWWIDDAKEEVFAKVGKAKNVTQDKFDEIVDSVLRKYSRFKDMTEDTLDKARKDMRRRWEEIQEETKNDSN